MALHGLLHERNTWVALRAIECVILCLPSPASPDYKPDDSQYQDIQAGAVRSLEAFSRLLNRPRAVEFRREIEDVFHTIRFRNYGDQATQITPKVVEAMAHFVDICEKKRPGEADTLMKYYVHWIRGLKRDLDSSVQVWWLLVCGHETRVKLTCYVLPFQVHCSECFLDVAELGDASSH